MTKTAIALRHLYFEDLGVLASVLRQAGYALRYVEATTADLPALDPLEADLLVALGGPVGIYESEGHSFLADEQRLLAARLASGRPTLGICLGAQLIAAALGARVAPMGHKEIGYSPLALTAAGRASPLRIWSRHRCCTGTGTCSRPRPVPRTWRRHRSARRRHSPSVPGSLRCSSTRRWTAALGWSRG